MTITEILLLICFIFGLYYLLRPIQQLLEGLLLKFLGAKNPRIIDATIIDDDKNKN